MAINRLDTHFHMIPPFWGKALEEKVGKPPWGTPDWSLDSALALLDRLGTEVGIISLAAPSVSAWEGEEQLTMTRKVNDFGMELLAKAPGRLGYFATLPLPNVAATLQEIDRAYDDYHADGVIVLSSYHGLYLGDPTLAPVWDALEKRQAVVFLHPGSPELKSLPGVPPPTVDFPMDTTRAAISLLTSGVLERCPSVRIILSHAGGFLPYAALRFGMLLPNYTLKDKSAEDVVRLLRQFYFDTALSTPSALPSLMGFADPTHIVFGSDNPYITPDQQARFTSELDQYPGFEPGQLDAINCGNGERLFPRLRQ